MKYRYFVNAVYHGEFEIEARSEGEADGMAAEAARRMAPSEMEPSGLEAGRMAEGGGWEQVLREGDI